MKSRRGFTLAAGEEKLGVGKQNKRRVEWLTYLSKHFTFIDNLWINTDRYDCKRLFGKAGQGKADETCHSV
jgi:hypothetical protein